MPDSPEGSAFDCFFAWSRYRMPPVAATAAKVNAANVRCVFRGCGSCSTCCALLCLRFMGPVPLFRHFYVCVLSVVEYRRKSRGIKDTILPDPNKIVPRRIFCGICFPYCPMMQHKKKDAAGFKTCRRRPFPYSLRPWVWIETGQ